MHGGLVDAWTLEQALSKLILHRLIERWQLEGQEMIGFVPFGGEKLCLRMNAPAILLKLDLAYVDEQVLKYGGLGRSALGVKNIYPYWFSKEDELGFTQRLLRRE